MYMVSFPLCRYISALLEDGEKPSLQQAVSYGWPASLHLIGKVYCIAILVPILLLNKILGSNNFIEGQCSACAFDVLVVSAVLFLCMCAVYYGCITLRC